MDTKKVDTKSIKLTLFFYHPTLRRESSFTAGPKATGLHTGYTRLQLLSYYFGPSTMYLLPVPFFCIALLEYRTHKKKISSGHVNFIKLRKNRCPFKA